MRRTSGHDEFMQSGNRSVLRRSRESKDSTMSDGGMDKARDTDTGRTERRRKRKIA